MQQNMKKSGRTSTSKSGQIDSLHVTFAEYPDQYVINSDSGIFLANDDVANDIPALEANKCDKVQANRPVRPILKLQKCVSVESQDNPFLRDGELMRKAEYIINNSTISRKRIRIADPDLVKSEPNKQNDEVISPDIESSEIVKVGGVELTCLSKDDLVVMDICSSDSNRDQSSLEDVRSLTNVDRSPSHVQSSPESRNDANILSSDVLDRLLVNLPEDDNDPHLETSKPLLPHDISNATHQYQISAQKVNGENPQARSQPQNYSYSNEILTNTKSGVNSKSKKKNKCCLLQ